MGIKEDFDKALSEFCVRPEGNINSRSIGVFSAKWMANKIANHYDDGQIPTAESLFIRQLAKDLE